MTRQQRKQTVTVTLHCELIGKRNARRKCGCGSERDGSVETINLDPDNSRNLLNYTGHGGGVFPLSESPVA